MATRGVRAQLREPGDYAAHAFAGWRGRRRRQADGSLRAFHNVCRHRAGRSSPTTRASGGELRLPLPRVGVRARRVASASARDFGDDSLDLTEFSLLEVRVAEWRGLVFVNLDADAPALADDHAAFFAAAADQPIEAFTYSHRLRARRRGELEGVLRQLRRGLPRAAGASGAQPGDRRQGVPRRRRRPLLRALRADARRRGERRSWLWRYPNLALNVYPGGMNVERFVPVGHRAHQRALRLLLP